MTVTTAVLSPAQKAWETRRAKLAASTAQPVTTRRRPVRAVERVSILAPKATELSPAQKAALSRRALAEARAKVQAVAAGVVEADAIGDTDVVDVWLDDAKVGSGWRRYVVLEKGARWVSLFYVPRLITIKVDRFTFDRNAKAVEKVRRAKIVGMITDNVALADRINDRAQSVVVSDGGLDAARAVKLLAGAA